MWRMIPDLGIAAPSTGHAPPVPPGQGAPGFGDSLLRAGQMLDAAAAVPLANAATIGVPTSTTTPMGAPASTAADMLELATPQTLAPVALTPNTPLPDAGPPDALLPTEEPPAAPQPRDAMKAVLPVIAAPVALPSPLAAAPPAAQEAPVSDAGALPIIATRDVVAPTTTEHSTTDTARDETPPPELPEAVPTPPTIATPAPPIRQEAARAQFSEPMARAALPAAAAPPEALPPPEARHEAPPMPLEAPPRPAPELARPTDQRAPDQPSTDTAPVSTAEAQPVAEPAAPPRGNHVAPARQLLPVTVALLMSPGAQPAFSITLEPQELGRVEVRLKRGADGESTLRIIAERPETAALLAREQRDLQQGLAQSGVTLTDAAISVELSGGDAQRDGRGDQRQGQQQRNNPAETITIRQDALPRSLLDMSI